MRKVIFYDPDITGHHCEYLRHPANFLVSQKEWEGVVVCNAVAGKDLINEYGENHPSLEIACIEKSVQRSIDSARSLWARGRASAKCFAESIERHQPELAIALSANPLQPFLNSAPFKDKGTRIRGIFFHPYPLAERQKFGGSTLKMRLTRLRKNCQVRWFASNRQIEKMFVLNDEKMACHLNKATGDRRLFESIPDPLPLYLDSREQVTSAKSNRKRFLFIGSINRRKGLIETLKAIDCLPKELIESFSLRIVGRFLDPLLKEEATRMIAQMAKEGHHIELNEGWITDAQFAKEIDSCDLVLAPYVGFHGSSGIIGHAAYFGKPLLATCEGLIGEIVQERDLGEVVQTREPKLYMEQLAKFLTKPWDYRSAQARYASCMSSESFIKQLMA